MVPLAADWYDRFLVERFARWLKEQDGAAHYVIDADSVRSALERGVTVRQMHAFLRRVTGRPVPRQVLHALKSWAGNGESAQ
jgi:hypothetical protein